MLRRLKNEDGEDFNSSRRSGFPSADSQTDSSNGSVQWDRKANVGLLLEEWLGSTLVVLGVEAACSLDILIMSSCLNLLKS